MADDRSDQTPQEASSKRLTFCPTPGAQSQAALDGASKKILNLPRAIAAQADLPPGLDVVTERKAAELLNEKPNFVSRHLRPRLPAVRVAGHWLYRRADIEALRVLFGAAGRADAE